MRKSKTGVPTAFLQRKCLFAKENAAFRPGEKNSAPGNGRSIDVFGKTVYTIGQKECKGVIALSVVLWILSVAAAVVLALSFAAYCAAFRAPKDCGKEGFAMPDDDQYGPLIPRTELLHKALAERPYGTAETVSFDDLVLRGRYYHQADGAPVAVMLHGYHSNALRDFCGGFALAWDSGFNVLLADQRAHGKSEGKTISFGVRERYDCLAWARYAAARAGENTPILLFGISMGAATVLMASELELPANVRGIVADCPYSSPEAILAKVCGGDMHLPVKAVMPFLALGARLFGGFGLRESSAVEAVRRSRVPLLLIHGEDDRFVPCSMAVEIANAAEEAGVPVRLLTVPNAGHGISYLVDAQAYTGAVKEFLRTVLPEGPDAPPRTDTV